jgi:hypothetical protein
MRYAPLHRLHSRELCLLRLRARSRAWAGMPAPAAAFGALVPVGLHSVAKGLPARAAACLERAAHCAGRSLRLANHAVRRTREVAGGRADGCGPEARDWPAQPPGPLPQPHVVPKVAAAELPMEGFSHAHALRT